jgi:hypothetical protein
VYQIEMRRDESGYLQNLQPPNPPAGHMHPCPPMHEFPVWMKQISMYPPPPTHTHTNTPPVHL